MTEYSNIIFARNAQTAGNYETLGAMLYAFGERLIKNLNTCTPAIVEEVFPDSRKATVRPLIRQPQSNDQSGKSLSVSVTVLQHQAGNFYVHSPIAKGDTGWLIAADWDTEFVKYYNQYIAGEGAGDIGLVDNSGKVLKNEGPQPPATLARHQFTQGFFLPDKWGGVWVPPKFKDSFIIQHVLPDFSSRGSIILDKDGTVHIFSTRWHGENGPTGGLVDIDLRYEDDGTQSSGTLSAIATAIVKGDEYVQSWEDEYKKTHGGNLFVEKDTRIGGNLGVTGAAEIQQTLEVGSTSKFKDKVVVVSNNKSAIIDPTTDLDKTEARFRPVTVLTGFHYKRGTKVALTARKMRVLTDLPVKDDDVEFEVGGGSDGGSDGGSGVKFRGTDGSDSIYSDSFIYESYSDANIAVKCQGNKLIIGAYYI